MRVLRFILWKITPTPIKWEISLSKEYIEKDTLEDNNLR